MGVRTNVDLAFQIGRENSLSKLVFDGAYQEVLDTLERHESGTIELDAGESNYQIPFGDVLQSRVVYIEATGPVRITPGGGLATSAQVDAVGGAYPSGFDGTDDTLELAIDGTDVTVDFLATDQSLTQVINRINAAAMLAGVVDGAGNPAPIVRDNGAGQLRFESPTTGVSSEVQIKATSEVSTLAALGLTADTTNGVNASAGQTPLTLLVPSSGAAGGPSDVRAFILATLVTGALTLDNLDPDNAVTVTFAIAGDLLTEPPTSC